MEAPNHPRYVVRIHPAYASELDDLIRRELRELKAIYRTHHLLEQAGHQLGHPDASAIRGARGLRELRPRRGRSRHRVLYAPTDGGFELLALAPEAAVSPHRFRAAIERALRRLDSEPPRRPTHG